MSFGTALVAIVAILAFAAMRIARHNASGGRGDFGPRAPSHRESELEREVTDLQKRIAVLERLVTDDRQSTAIAREIEALRDR